MLAARTGVASTSAPSARSTRAAADVYRQSALSHTVSPTRAVVALSPTDRRPFRGELVKTAAVAVLEKVEGHSALIHGLGDVGDVSAALVPWLLRLGHIKTCKSGGDSAKVVQESARGLLAWRVALERGVLPDDETLKQLKAAGESFTVGHDIEDLRWPGEPLRTMMIRALSKLGVSRFAMKYPGVRDALLKSILEVCCKYYRTVFNITEEEEEQERDASGQVFKSAAELQREAAAQRASRVGDEEARAQTEFMNKVAAATATAAAAAKARAAAQADMPLEKKAALELVKGLYKEWQGPVETLSRAGRAFDGLEVLLGGGKAGSFDLKGGIWQRAGWSQMDMLRKKLEDLKELRDLVRSLGRGGGWGPLRRAPIQYLDFKGRPGLLRTILEAQETRGLTRGDDISRLLPSESAMLARGKEKRQAKLLFYAKLAEKSLQVYERDGWGEYDTNIIPERREIRPTADRGPILLCVDTSGSMRGARETVAKALALECMRAAKEQERGCFVFAFSGPQEVRELELGCDMASVSNLLEFLEKVFNGGSDFNEPVKRCLGRLTEAAWANSDILLVSDGELRQPGPEIMRKLVGAKEKLGLRVHGLIVGSPEKKRADPAVLRALCTNYLPNGKSEVLVSEFSNWASVTASEELKFDWDDTEGNTRRRLAGLRLEKLRQEEIRRKRLETKPAGRAPSGVGSRKKH